jgi:hypothetical protein
MAVRVERVDVWVAPIEDKPGALAAKLGALSVAGANLQFLLARRKGEEPGLGVVFLTPLKGAAQMRAASSAGFNKVERVQAVRVEATDKPGLAAALTQKVADAGINLRGFSAAAIGKTALLYLGFDNAADAAKAAKLLKK